MAIVKVEVPDDAVEAATHCLVAGLYGTYKEHRVMRLRFDKRMRTLGRKEVRECAEDFGACAKTYWEWRDKHGIPMKRRL